MASPIVDIVGTRKKTSPRGVCDTVHRPTQRMPSARAVGAWGSSLGLGWEWQHREMADTVCPVTSHFPVRNVRGLSFSFFQIHETIETINQLKTQREFMLSFARDPQGFINDWLQSQCRDLKVKNLWKLHRDLGR